MSAAVQGFFFSDFCDQKCGKFHSPPPILVISTQTVWHSQHNTSVEPGIYRGNSTLRSRKVSALHRTQRSLPYSDQAATWISLQPDESSSCYPILFKIHFNIILSPTTRPSKWNWVCGDNNKVDLGNMIRSQFLIPQRRSPVTRENKNMTTYLQGSPAHGTLACDPIHPVGQHHACGLCNKSIKYAAQGHTTQGSLCGICGLPTDNGTKSSQSASIFPCQYHPTNAPYSHFFHLLTLYGFCK
jgi:hypothetical protein